MSRGASELTSIIPGIVLCIILITGYRVSLRADAFLAEDRVYYGADSYNINYKDEIINGKGNAYFRKEGTSVRAREIVIYYGKNEKRAVFHRNVRIYDSERNYELRGDYGEAYYGDEYVAVQGNVIFIDDQRKVTAGQGESRGMKSFTFTEDVLFIDEGVTVQSQTLEVQPDETALFRDDVHVVFTESGDDLYCDALTYLIETGDSECRGNVIYMQKGSEEGEEEPFVVKSEMAQFFSESNLFLLMDGVYVTNGRYSFTAPIVKYFRERRVIESVGETVIKDSIRTVYCDRMVLDLNENKITFFGTIQGVFNLE